MQTINKSETLVYSIAETARLLGMSAPSVYRAIKSGTIKTKRIGGRILIPRAALDELLKT